MLGAKYRSSSIDLGSFGLSVKKGAGLSKKVSVFDSKTKNSSAVASAYGLETPAVLYSPKNRSKETISDLLG